MKIFRKIASDYLKKKGYGIIDHTQYLVDLDKDFFEMWNIAEKYTMISVERAYSLYASINYILSNNIRGDIVECGVWRGGACMLAALALIKNSSFDRKIFMYDTFEGMPVPGSNDKVAWNGKSALGYWKKNRTPDGKNMWAADLDEVKENMKKTGYPEKNIVFCKGDVADTLHSDTVPGEISLLRLDTDWYESTKIELEKLYPLLTDRGVLLIDDYGHFSGARKAVDEYFSRKNDLPGILLNRIDYTGRTGVKFKRE